MDLVNKEKGANYKNDQKQHVAANRINSCEQKLNSNKNDSKLNKLLKQFLIQNSKSLQLSSVGQSSTLRRLKKFIKYNGSNKQDFKLLGGGSCLSCNCNNNFQEIKQADIEDIEDLNNDSIIFYKYEEEKEETKYDQINYFNQQYSNFIQSQRIQKVLSENSYLNEVYLILNEFMFSNINLIMQNIDEFKVFVMDMLELLIYYVMCSMLLSSISNQKQSLHINQTIQNSINSIIKYISKIDFDYPCLDISFMLNLIKQQVESNSSALDFSKEDQLKIYLVIQCILKMQYNLSNYEDVNQLQNNLLQLNQTFSRFIQRAYYQNQQNQQNYSHTFTRYDITNIYLFSISIIVNKFQLFGIQFSGVSIIDELNFYVTKLLQIYLKGSKNVIIYLLIKINTLLEKGLNGDSNEFTKNLADKFTQNTEIYAQLQDFINSIQPKDQQILNKYQEIVMQIKHPEFRFLSVQILLKLINIINYIDYQQSETVLIHLCTQYLCENDQSVKIVFKNNFKLQSFLRRIKNNKIAQQRVRDCTILKRKQLTVITEVDEQINEK
ncbi:hypothetical protein ABPG72_004621 [Tetrahymena utriculariae]